MLNWTSWMCCTWKGCALSQYSLVLKSSPNYATGPNPLSGVTTFLLQRNVASRNVITFIAWLWVKIFSKIAYDSKYGTSRIDCARKMSSILGQNCPSEFRVATFPIQVTDISCPLLSTSLHASLLTSFPPLLCLFLPPLFLPLVQGEVVTHFAFTPENSPLQPPTKEGSLYREVCVVLLFCVCVCVFM